MKCCGDKCLSLLHTHLQNVSQGVPVPLRVLFPLGSPVKSSPTILRRQVEVHTL